MQSKQRRTFPRIHQLLKGFVEKIKEVIREVELALSQLLVSVTQRESDSPPLR